MYDQDEAGRESSIGEKRGILVTAAQSGEPRDYITAHLPVCEKTAAEYLKRAERYALNLNVEGADGAPRPIERVGIVGAGTMGRGIGIAFANAGFPVKLIDSDETALARAIPAIETTYARAVGRGSLDEAEAKRRSARIQLSPSLHSLHNADLVVEAVFENLAIKRAVFAQLDSICPPSAILATNTSFLDVNALATSTQRPQNVLGLHFFAPAHVMRMVEVVRASATSVITLSTAMNVVSRLGKVGVVTGVCFGFVANRMGSVYGEEAARLMFEGATPWQIDQALQEWGMAMGPFATGDLSGLDIDWRARQERELTAEQRRLAAVDDELVARGRLGQKTGAGFHRYDHGGGLKARRDREVEALILSIARARGIATRAISNEEIIDRCLLQLVNAGAWILQEGIVARASDIDLVFAYGLGFPRARGGPMFIADQLGASAVVRALDGYAARYGAHWIPTALLRDAAAAAQPPSTLEKLSHE